MTDKSKTSIYLNEETAARVAATGMKPAELLRLGLDTAEGKTRSQDLETTMRRVIREESAPGLHINVLARFGADTWHLAGSFDYRKAERFRGPDGPENLYRTIEGRWVLSAPATAANENIVVCAYVTDDQARAWLRENGHEDALRRFAAAASS